jgi:hypothetical protein
MYIIVDFGLPNKINENKTKKTEMKKMEGKK